VFVVIKQVRIVQKQSEGDKRQTNEMANDFDNRITRRQKASNDGGRLLGRKTLGIGT
jgi:hypothetical protein